MASIYERIDKNGNKTFQAKVRMKGYPSQSKTFARKTDAKKWARKIENELIEGKHFASEQIGKRDIEQLIDRYIDEILPLKPKSYRDQKYQLNYWKEAFRGKTIGDVNAALISEEKIKLSKGKTNRGIRSQARVNRYLAVLSHMYTIAVKEWGWAYDNPVSKVSRFKESAGRTRFLSDDERKRLLDACKASQHQYLYIIVVLALSTGARRNEIMFLKWDDLDFEREVIVLSETKNKEIRVLPLQSHALSL